MTDAKVPVKSPAHVTPAATPATEAATIQVPLELCSKNKSIRITREKDVMTIELTPAVVAEIGSYHRVSVKVMFVENGNVAVVPLTQ